MPSRPIVKGSVLIVARCATGELQYLWRDGWIDENARIAYHTTTYGGWRATDIDTGIALTAVCESREEAQTMVKRRREKIAAFRKGEITVGGLPYTKYREMHRDMEGSKR